MNAVPSLFAWTRTSPRKRKAPTVRENIGETSRVLLLEPETNEEPSNIENAVDEDEGETNESEGIMKRDIATQTNEIELKDSVAELKQQLVDLKYESEKAEKRIDSLQKQLFTVDRFKGDDSSIKFYTGFPNWETFQAVFKYLNPGNERQNITYWLSQSNVNVSADSYKQNEEPNRKKEDRDP